MKFGIPARVRFDQAEFENEQRNLDAMDHASDQVRKIFADVAPGTVDLPGPRRDGPLARRTMKVEPCGWGLRRAALRGNDALWGACITW